MDLQNNNGNGNEQGKLAYTLQEFSIATGLSVPHLRNEIAKKKIKATRSGRRVIITAPEAQRYLGFPSGNNSGESPNAQSAAA